MSIYIYICMCVYIYAYNIYIYTCAYCCVNLVCLALQSKVLNFLWKGVQK